MLKNNYYLVKNSKKFGYFKIITYLCIIKLNNIKTMNTQEIVKKLAELLYKDEGVYDGVVYFDWSSYDLDEDIPNLTIDNKIVQIEEFRVNKEGTQIAVISGNDNYILDLTTNPFTEQEYEDMGMYTLLNSVYYETDYSLDIGDFEIDFLGI